MTGSACLNNRYHDPILGTFVSVDPLVTITGEAYIDGAANPITYSDPTGLDPDTSARIRQKVEDAGGCTYSWGVKCFEAKNPLLGYYRHRQAGRGYIPDIEPYVYTSPASKTGVPAHNPEPEYTPEEQRAVEAFSRRPGISLIPGAEDMPEDPLQAEIWLIKHGGRRTKGKASAALGQISDTTGMLGLACSGGVVLFGVGALCAAVALPVAGATGAMEAVLLWVEDDPSADCVGAVEVVGAIVGQASGGGEKVEALFDLTRWSATAAAGASC